MPQPRQFNKGQIDQRRNGVYFESGSASKASSLVLLGGRNKKAPGKALVCVWLGGEGVCFPPIQYCLFQFNKHANTALWQAFHENSMFFVVH
jgi:hypothetical protein